MQQHFVSNSCKTHSLDDQGPLACFFRLANRLDTLCPGCLLLGCVYGNLLHVLQPSH